MQIAVRTHLCKLEKREGFDGVLLEYAAEHRVDLCVETWVAEAQQEGAQKGYRGQRWIEEGWVEICIKYLFKLLLNVGLVLPTSDVSPKLAKFGRLRKIKKKAIMCMTKPSTTIGSRPIFLAVRAPMRPKATPPDTSPTPMKIPDSPTSCLADSPMAFVKPMLGEYTPLKNDSSNPVGDKKAKTYGGERMKWNERPQK